MMGECVSGCELSYCIEWVNHPAARADGGGVSDPLIETRERLVRVEARQSRMGDSVERIEEKVDETHSLVQEVDEGALSTDRFEEDYEPVIDRGRRAWFVARLTGGTLVTAFAVLELAARLGYTPL